MFLVMVVIVMYFWMAADQHGAVSVVHYRVRHAPHEGAPQLVLAACAQHDHHRPGLLLVLNDVMPSVFSLQNNELSWYVLIPHHGLVSVFDLLHLAILYGDELLTSSGGRASIHRLKVAPVVAVVHQVQRVARPRDVLYVEFEGNITRFGVIHG